MQKVTGFARIAFLSHAEGGRQSPPEPAPGKWLYRPIVVFEGHDLEEGTYSMGMCFDGPADASGVMWADIQYAVDEAPHDCVVLGAKFKAYEGGRLVAHGEVTGLR